MAKGLGLKIPISVIDRFSGALNKAQDKFKNWGKNVESFQTRMNFSKKKLGIPKIEKSFEDLGKKLKPLAVGFGAMAIAGVGAFALVKSSAEKMTALEDFSKTAGMTVESIQELRFAATQMGSSAEEMDSGLRTFTEGMGKARSGSGKLLTFLEKINPAFAKQLMATKTNEEGFNLMLGALQKLDDPQRKLALATMAFGSAGESLARVSGEGAAKLKAMREEARKFGLVTQDDIAHAAEFDDGLNKLMFAFDLAKNKIATALMPAFSNMFSKISDWLSKNQDKVQRFGNFLADGLPKAIEMVLSAFNSLSNSTFLSFLITVSEKVGAINLLFIGLGTYMAATFISTISSVILAFTSLGFTLTSLSVGFGVITSAATAAWVAITGPIGLIIAGIAAVGVAAYMVYKHWDSIKEVLGNVWDIIKKITNMGLDKLKGFFGFSSGKQNIQNNNVTNVANNTTLGANRLGANELGQKQFEIANKKSETDVNIRFDNLPKGARVDSNASADTNLNLGMGYAGVSPL